MKLPYPTSATKVNEEIDECVGVFEWKNFELSMQTILLLRLQLT